MLPAKMLRQREDCGISKQVEDRDISLEEFLQLAMNLDNMYGSTAEIKEIVIDTYIHNLKYLSPDGGDDLL
jgi:hypothetical protein